MAVRSSKDGIIIKSEDMEKDKIYTCIHENRVFLFFKNELGLLNCYEVQDEEVAEKIKANPDSDSVKKILEDLLESNDY
ncbi:MAG: hypothetical protein D6752_03680 [Candidatus Nitrosothermus koennekii]|jgi:hypothetical protein|nr:MAG: hypothetical protein D6752_03680 [Candidatus Nitrosothermus koennekii]